MHLPFIFMWYKKQDKKLVFTSRVKRFFSFLLGATLFQDLLCLVSPDCKTFGVIFAIFIAFIASSVFENYLALLYRQRAKRKIQSLSHLKVVAITASFGKTSIKNFLFELLEKDFRVYKTPRSINTEMGLIADINNNLEKDTEIYIAEAGARKQGDIALIGSLLQHQYAILGEIGEQHIEYFKTLENIKHAKREIFRTPNLTKAVIHESAEIGEDEVVTVYSKRVTNVVSNLEGTSWDLDIDGETIHLETEILGRFSAYNISAAFIMALQLGGEKERLIKKVKTLKPVEHRLQKIITPNKLIIDDSFNGNLNGMLEACHLASCYEGRKVIVTPGIVESDDESNIKFAKEIDKVFDLIIITGTVNSNILSEHITSSKRKRILDKSMVETLLGQETRDGDLIIFSNDTPTFM